MSANGRMCSGTSLHPISKLSWITHLKVDSDSGRYAQHEGSGSLVMAKKKNTPNSLVISGEYGGLLLSVSELLEQARRTSARAVNAILTATYWEIGARIVEYEQRGRNRANYGEGLLEKLSKDLTSRFGRGFSVDNLESMRLFYLSFPRFEKSETLSRISAKDNSVTPSRKLDDNRFLLPWSHYVLLVRRVASAEARAFYESEAVRGGWSVRQLDRQVRRSSTSGRRFRRTKKQC